MATINVRAAIFAALFLVAPATLAAQSVVVPGPDWSTASHRILPLIVGGGWGTSFTTVNNGDAIQTKFVWKSLSGEDINLSVWETDGRFAGTGPIMKFGMGPRTTAKTELTSPGLVLGWIDHSILPGLNGEPSTSVSATIRQDGIVGEAIFSEVIPKKTLSFSVDQLGGAKASLLLVNPNDKGVMARVTLRNCDGGDLGAQEASLPPFGGIAAMLSVELGLCGIGVADIVADGEIAAFGFKMNANGGFSAVPPGPGRQ